MFLKNEYGEIEIIHDSTYTIDSADNRHYDVILNPGHFRRSDMSKTLAIHINLLTGTLCIALTGSFYSYDSDCAVLEGETLTVLQDNVISQIKITDGSLIRSIPFECVGCNFAIYRIAPGYIIQGEIEITMLDTDFNKKWSFAGRDIFASVLDKKPFTLRANSICLYDFEDNYYEIDFAGNQIG